MYNKQANKDNNKQKGSADYQYIGNKMLCPVYLPPAAWGYRIHTFTDNSSVV